MSFQTYIAEGFLEDCEELIHTLTERHEIIDWQKFCACWKEMDFDIMFYGRQSSPEVVEFTEEVLQIARLYLVTETDNFEDQVIGLFIAYAITIIQPYKNLCSLRIVPKDIPALKKIEEMARRDNRRDILIVLGRMYICGKVHFHVSERERAMDAPIRKYFDGSMFVPRCTAKRWRGGLDRRHVRMLEEIATAETQYTDLKARAKMVPETGCPGTNVYDTFKPMAKEMAESLRKLTSGESISKQDDEDMYVSMVKQKAMKKTVDSMRHLTSVADRPNEKNTAKSPKPSTSKKKQTRNEISPTRDAPSQQCFSLPSLDDLDTTPVREDREKSPEAPFKGFTVEEIKTSDYEIIKKTITNEKKESYKTLDLKGKPAHGVKKMNRTVYDEPQNWKRKMCENILSKDNRKIKKLKNKNNKKLRLHDFSLYNISDEDTSESLNDKDTHNESLETLDELGDEKEITSQPKELYKEKEVIIEPNKLYKDRELTIQPNELCKEKELMKQPNELCKEKELSIESAELCKGKEFVIQTKGVEKHYVEFEVSDIVIRTERDAPQNDIEIEYIDNYSGPNALYEEVCELSDEEDKNDKTRENNTDVSSQNDEVIECNENGTNDDIEMFQLVSQNTNTEKTKKTTRRTKSRHNPEVDDTMHRILRSSGSMARRKMKQPQLKSKLKRMGILPVANFDDVS